MNIYEAVYNRRSVRKYRMEALPPELLEQIDRFMTAIVPLDRTSRLEMEILENISGKQKIRGMFKVEAPYYLSLYCEDSPAAYRNAGYMAEQVVLYLTTKGIATCYLGETKVGAAEKNGLKRLLVIAFGRGEGDIYRDKKEAHRFSLNSLCAWKDEPGENIKTILNAARLAPSSFNSQPWRFVVYSDRIYIFSRKDALLHIKSMASMRDFNMGIMLSHIMLAAEELCMNMETVTDQQFLKKDYKNGQYICTIVFHN